MNWELRTIKVKDLIEWSGNPRKISREDLDNLKQSFVEFGHARTLTVAPEGKKFVIIGGNQSLKALKELDFKEIQCSVCDREMTEAEKQKLSVFLNHRSKGEGEWDYDILNTWDVDLEDWGVEQMNFETETKITDEQARTKLQDMFIGPPFSILDTRQGYWQERKKYWRELIGDNGESRENTLFRSSGDPVSDKLQKSGGVSILDPVLSELVNLWFGLPKSKTFDCFAGDSVFGYVSSYLGNEFTGIELRKEQADLNNKRVNGFQSKYICDDGQNVLNHIEPNSQDLLFSCPPYFDLEVYSDMPNDASNQKEYSDFLKILDNAFTGAIKCLKDNRFAVITVGDVRDKKGFYYRFVDDIKDIFKNNGVKLYNELILIETAGTAALRAVPNMKYRKVVKTHQNVLVFFKGDPKKIKEIYPKIEHASEDLESFGVQDTE